MDKLFVSYVVAFMLVLAYTRCDEVSGTNESSSAETNLTQFRCFSNDQTIDVFKRGDGNYDCEDKSDEDKDRTGNQTILYFVGYDIDDQEKRTDYLKGIYVNSTAARGEFQVKIPACTNEWKILYADKSYVHLRCYFGSEFQIMSVKRGGESKIYHNFTLSGANADNLLGFLTNSSTGKPTAYFKYKSTSSSSSTFIKMCTENDRKVADCPNLNYNDAYKPDNLVFSPKNNGTLFWLEKKDVYKATIIKYSMITGSGSNIGPEIKQPNHLTKDAATNRLYVQVLSDDFKDWIQSFNFNGEQTKKIKKVEADEKNQFAVHNNVIYWTNETEFILYCDATNAGDCEKPSKYLSSQHLNSTFKPKISSIYVYDYETNLEENVPNPPLLRDSNLLLIFIVGGLVTILLFIGLAYVLGKKKGERTQSMEIHEDILTGTLRRKPTYCNEESLLTKGKDAIERTES